MAGRRHSLLGDEHLKNISDEYTLGAELGKGKFGVARRGTRKSDQAAVAVKTISKRKITGSSDIAQLRAEIDIMQKVDHPHIIKYFDCFEDRQDVHVVLELCTGGELFDRIMDKNDAGETFREHDAARLIRQILSAVAHCHHAGIVHRDLKPENFLFASPAEDAPIKVIDFGLSKEFVNDGNHMMTTGVGTPYYISPEILKSQPYGPECDAWSIGVITYIIVSGIPPFAGQSDAQTFKLIKAGDWHMKWEPFNSVSELCKEFIRALIVVDVGSRMTIDQALEHPWVKEQGEDNVLDNNLFSSLKNFTSVRKFKKVALQVLSQKVSEQEKTALKEEFDKLDTDASGALSLEELRQGFQRAGSEGERDIASIMKEVDADGSGAIDYNEFLQAMMHNKEFQKTDRLREVFEMLDVSHSGQITAADLMEAERKNHVLTQALGLQAGVSLDYAALITEADTNGDGVVDFSEFIGMFQ